VGVWNPEKVTAECHYGTEERFLKRIAPGPRSPRNLIGEIDRLLQERKSYPANPAPHAKLLFSRCVPISTDEEKLRAHALASCVRRAGETDDHAEDRLEAEDESTGIRE